MTLAGAAVRMTLTCSHLIGRLDSTYADFDARDDAQDAQNEVGGMDSVSGPHLLPGQELGDRELRFARWPALYQVLFLLPRTCGTPKKLLLQNVLVPRNFICDNVSHRNTRPRYPAAGPQRRHECLAAVVFVEKVRWMGFENQGIEWTIEGRPESCSKLQNKADKEGKCSE